MSKNFICQVSNKYVSISSVDITTLADKTRVYRNGLLDCENAKSSKREILKEECPYIKE